MTITWSPLAIERVSEIAEYISVDSPTTASLWVNDIFDRTELLGSQPEMGRKVPELLGSSYREIVFGSYRIIYKIEHEIKILTLRNSRQLLSSDNVEL